MHVGLQIDDALMHEGEHRLLGIDPGSTEHAPDHDHPEGGEQFADILGGHHRRRRGYCCASAAGLSCTDSPQPQADVWFGLLNTNWVESFSDL